MTVQPLPPMSPDQAAQWLAAPWLPATTAAQVPLAVAALRAGLPVVLRMAPGRMRLRVVRAIHALAAPGQALPRGGPETHSGTVTLCDAADADWDWLACALDDGPVARLVVACPDVALPPAWVPVVLDVPSLASRAEQAPALVAALAAKVAARMGRTPPGWPDAIVATLAAGAWPGDVDALEQALTAACLDDATAWSDGTASSGPALAHGAPAPPGADGAGVPAPAPAGAPAPATEAVDAPAEVTDAPAAVVMRVDPQVELLLAEMAHEIRNPLVTIKTFAGHLPALLDDPALRDRFAALTDEAIARMEAVLDNVLDFGRLGVPQQKTIDVSHLLDEAVAAVAPALDERAIAVERTGADPVTCAGDGEHVAYGLRNLLAGVVRETASGERLRIDTAANGVVRLRFAPGAGAAATLRAVLRPEAGSPVSDPTLQPLAFTLARAALERAGGRLVFECDGEDGAAVVVHLPRTMTS